jgi:hypothetical protein
LTGADLVGARYRRPIDWLPYPAGTNHEIVVGEPFVSADDGSGVVHMAPAFGATTMPPDAGTTSRSCSRSMRAASSRRICRSSAASS